MLDTKFNRDEPIFTVIEPDGKTYKISPSGMIEGFSEHSVIFNGINALANYAQGLTKKALDSGLISASEAAYFLP